MQLRRERTYSAEAVFGGIDKIISGASRQAPVRSITVPPSQHGLGEHANVTVIESRTICNRNVQMKIVLQRPDERPIISCKKLHGNESAKIYAKFVKASFSETYDGS